MKEWNDILLVEDNPGDAELIIWILRNNNIANGLLHLQNGEEVLDYLFAAGKYKDRNIEQIPKLILLDLKMPKISGLEVLEKIKADERTKGIPVVLLSSSGEEMTLQLAMNSG